MGTRSLLQVTLLVLLLMRLSAHVFCQSEASPAFSNDQPNKPGSISAAPATAPSPLASSDSGDQPAISLKRVFLNLPGDQKTIWSSPFHLRAHDAYWLAPFAATTGVLIGSDAHSMERAHSNVG